MNEDNLFYFNEYYVSVNNFAESVSPNDLATTTTAPTANLFAYNSNNVYEHELQNNHYFNFDYLNINQPHRQIYDSTFLGNYDYNLQFSNRNNNSLNWNTFLNNTNNNKQQGFVSDSYIQATEQNENLNLIRNIENLKLLWQTNSKTDGEDDGYKSHIETLQYPSYQPSMQNVSSIRQQQQHQQIHQQQRGNSMRTFADVAKTTTNIRQPHSIINSSSSCASSSISSSSSSSASPPIFKLSNPIKPLVKQQTTIPSTNINNNDNKTKLAHVSRNAISNCRSSNSVFSSGSLDSVEDDVTKVIAKKTSKKLAKRCNIENSSSIVKPKELKRQDQVRSVSSISSDDDNCSFGELSELEISLRDIKPDSKYGLDKFDKADILSEKARMTILRKKSKNKRKISSDKNQTKLSNQGKPSSIATNDNYSKAGKKSKIGNSNQQKKIELLKNEAPITNYNDIWECIKELFNCFITNLKTFFGLLFAAFAILFGCLVEVFFNLIKSVTNYIINKYIVFKYYFTNYVCKFVASVLRRFSTRLRNNFEGAHIDESNSYATKGQLKDKKKVMRKYDKFFEFIMRKFQRTRNSSSNFEEINSVVKNIFYCHQCNRLHKRVEIDRAIESARFCSSCRSYHPVNENDLWSERTGFWNVKISFYACMEKKLYDVSELIKCRLNEVDFIMSNSHNVTGRVVCEYKVNWNTSEIKLKDEIKTNKQVYSLKFEHVENYVNEVEIVCATRRNSSSASSSCETQNGSAKLLPKEHVIKKKCKKI